MARRNPLEVKIYSHGFKRVEITRRHAAGSHNYSVAEAKAIVLKLTLALEEYKNRSSCKRSEGE